MTRLLSANLRRLKINIPFYVFSFIILAVSIFFTSKGYLLMFGEYMPVEVAIVLISAVPAGLNTLFISFFIGREYSDKTIRNKIVVGYTKGEIYGAALLTTSLVTIFWVVLWFVGSIFGAVLTGGEYSMESLIVKALVALLYNLAFSSALTAMCMTIHSRALCVVLNTQIPSYLITFILSGTFIGEGAYSPFMENLLTFIINLLPMGQWFYKSVGFSEILYPSPVLMALSAGIIILFTAVGAVLFRKKELK